MDKSHLMVIGRILGVHGIKGELKILPLTDNPERFFNLDSIAIQNGKREQEYAISNCRIHKGHVLLLLNEIDNRNDAELLIGKEIAIPRDQAVDLGEDEFFIEDLMGLPVYNEGVYLGKISYVLQTGGVDVYTITEGDKNYLVPARSIYFEEINIAEGRIDASIPQDILSL
jgi:16S rRNA processing protein RimM